MEGRKKKRKKEEQKEKSFVLNSYFFRVHVDYLDTHLIRFSFIQHESLPLRYINLNALTSVLASSESLQYSHNWLAYFPTHFIFLPLEASSLPFRTCPTELFAISQLKWTLALTNGSLRLPLPPSVYLCVWCCWNEMNKSHGISLNAPLAAASPCHRPRPSLAHLWCSLLRF